MVEPAEETSVSKRPLKVGLMLPDTELEMGGGSARWNDLLRMAQLAEEMGFDSIWVSDHLIFRFEDKAPQGVWECWSLLAALAAVTQRVELGPLVSCTSFRNPALLAKIADTIDEISGGRLILGLGAGWHEPEYTAFGYPFDHRVSRFAEAMAIIHGLLRHGQVDLDGTYYQARDCELRPRGPRPPGSANHDRNNWRANAAVDRSVCRPLERLGREHTARSRRATRQGRRGVHCLWP